MKNCLLLNKKPVRFSICVSLLTAACVGMLNAVDTVPDNWNVAPMINGAYLESFESTLPAWASAPGASVVTNVFPDMSGSSLPTRSNAWFATHLKVMALDTEGTVISNVLQNSDENPVSFATNPVYVDMRVRFNPMEDDPGSEVLSNCKLAVYVNSDCKLVVAHNGGSSTNSTELDTNKWHQITVRMTNNACNVYLNDQIVFDDITLNNSGTANELDALSFTGAGYIDELYVSHGAPDYAVVGPTSEIPDLPDSGSNVPSDEQQTRINKYLSDQSGLSSLGTITQDQLSAAYLVNAPLTDVATAPAVSFGISAIDIIDATHLKITASLAVDSTAKAGDINGSIQLQGKVNKGDDWITLDGAVTLGSVTFADGEFTFTYTIPASNCRFFKGLIISKEI